MATSSRHRGWLFDAANSRLAATFNGTEVFDFDANDMAIAQALTLNANLTLPGGTDIVLTGATGTNDITLTNGLADALSITDGAADVMVFDTSTAGNVITMTAAVSASGNISISGNDTFFRANTGNVAIGNPGTFATTQPRGAVVMGGSSLSGIAPVGAITTAGAIFASDTVVRKIIAAGTASNVET